MSFNLKHENNPYQVLFSEIFLSRSIRLRTKVAYIPSPKVGGNPSDLKVLRDPLPLFAASSAYISLSKFCLRSIIQ